VQHNRKFKIAGLILSGAILSACGGGGSDSPPGNSNSNITPTIDLKSASGAKILTAVMAIDFNEAQVTSYSFIVQDFPVSATNTSNCNPSGSRVTTFTNPDGILSVGDSKKFESRNCAFNNPAGLDNSTETETVTAVSGPTNDAKGLFSLTTNRTFTGNFDRTQVLSGITYRRILTSLNRTDTVTYVQDGKNTASTADDVFTQTSTSNVNGVGTLNGAAISLTGSTSAICSVTGTSTASTTCSKFENSLAGSIPGGAINASTKQVTPLTFNSIGEPVGGSLLITQGADTATVNFSLVGTVPTVKVTSGSLVQTFTYAELSALADTLY
jgi:hypothetical protein